MQTELLPVQAPAPAERFRLALVPTLVGIVLGSSWIAACLAIVLPT